MADNDGRLISKALDIGLVAHDLEAMKAFYGDGLGMPRIKDLEFPGVQLTRFKAGRGILKFNQAPTVPDPAPGDVVGGRGMKMLTIVVPDLQATSEKLHAAGFDGLAIEDHGKYTVAFTTDPDETLVELVGYKGFGETPVIQAVGITVGDMAASHTFLTEVLGFKESGIEPVPSLGTDKHEFSAGATTLKLWQIDGLEAHTGPVQAYAGIRYLTAVVDDIDAILSRARDAGRKIPLGPVDLAPGVQIAMVEDPDGNWFELLQLNQT